MSDEFIPQGFCPDNTLPQKIKHEEVISTRYPGCGKVNPARKNELDKTLKEEPKKEVKHEPHARAPPIKFDPQGVEYPSISTYRQNGVASELPP